MVKFCARISDKVVTRETGPVAMEAHGLFTKDEESGGYSLEEAGRALAAQLKADTPGLVAALEKATRDAVAAASKPPKAASVPASVASSSSTKPTPKVAASKPASGAVAGKAALTVAKNAADIVLGRRDTDRSPSNDRDRSASRRAAFLLEQQVASGRYPKGLGHATPPRGHLS